ncbi:hypothetical protein GCM10011452_37050 [Gemmobacter lanyuensis]|uniref:HTH-like domain-containing protein n=1 Tax=Gemmobacter lanyuensis TaxID=1054497 RepID=A0A918J4W2_9RHOB|nr:hypothetical protein GCM10011452_37050 [Gemmobacter lanyuensis]
MVRYQSRREPDTVLRGRLRDLANERRRFGYQRLFILLRREGEASGINRIYRLYREEGLTVRKRKARRKAIGTRAPILIEARANARWSLDFVHDQFACGRRFRVLNVVDDVTRECFAAIPDTSISGRRMARELTALIERRGRPGMIVLYNVLARERNAVLGVRSRGIRATGCLLNSCPGGLRRQEVVSSMANTGSAWLPPSPSLRRDPKSQAEGPNIIYEVASCASTAL